MSSTRLLVIGLCALACDSTPPAVVPVATPPAITPPATAPATAPATPPIASPTPPAPPEAAVRRVFLDALGHADRFFTGDPLRLLATIARDSERAAAPAVTLTLADSRVEIRGKGCSLDLPLP